MRIISNKKIEEFKKKLAEKKIDIALFLTSDPIYDANIEYFTGLQEGFFSFSCLLMTKNKSTLIVSPSSYSQAVEETEVDEILGLEKYDRSLIKALKEKLKKVKSIGVIEDIFPYRIYRKFKHLKFQDIGDIILEIRGVKEKKEIERIKKACHIANHGIKVIEENLSKKITEKELALIIEQDLIRKGADELSFPTIVSSGKRTTFIHPYPPSSNQKIQPGLGLVDFGVRYNGYCSDVTVPFTIGRISEKQKKIVQTIEEAYELAIDNLKVGMPTWKVYETVENLIKKNGFELRHGLGHGLGLEIHDFPSISSKPKYKEQLKEWKEIKLKENMVFTIEPGIYEPKIGGCRLENDILLDEKPKILTKSKFINF